MDVKANNFNRLVLPDANIELMQCPNCAVQLKATEVAQHCEEETERLQRMQMEATDARPTLNEECPAGATAGTEERCKPWTVFQKVQRNRHLRLKQRLRKRPATTPPERACPVCNKTFTQDEIEQHVEACLKRSRITNGENCQSSSDDDEAGEEYEEYEWAGQKRIRVSSLLVGGYGAHGIGQTITNSNGHGRQEGGQTEEEEDLNVDEDDTHIYGPTQYDENDIILPDADGKAAEGNEEEDVTQYMRKLITAGSGENGEREKADDKHVDGTQKILEMNTEATTSNDLCLVERNTQQGKSTMYQQIIDSLKAKLRQYEQQQQSKFKCLICLDEYKKPAISVTCWHVHCEDCWLRSLGARKLCPQCNLITTPKDLRRIYM